MTMDKLKIACVQFTASDDIESNIIKVEKMVEKSALQGCSLITTPENTFRMEKTDSDKKYYNQDDHPAIIASSNMAKKHNIWLLIGSIAILSQDGTKYQKNFNRSLLFSPDGKIAAYYDKIHLFDVEVGDSHSYQESKRIKAGNKMGIVDTPWGKLGMTICYDLRFPQLYRQLAKAGARIITVPAAFTQKTGEAHWHTLLRARAIENSCFIIAPAQTGTHDDGKQTYGHSLIIDPWGKIIADGDVDETIITAELDLTIVEQVRKNLPSLTHDRDFS
ncbi:MAG: carbon-nitrogen hydrolase family protein [Rickettsiales bacterium]